MDRTKAKEFLRFIFSEFKKLNSELRTYETTFAILKTSLEPQHPGFAKLSDDSLAAVRASSALHDAMRKQYDEPLEEFLERVSQAGTEEEVEKLLLSTPVRKSVN